MPPNGRMDWFWEQLDAQDSRCAISGQPLWLHAFNKLSIERIDEGFGYIPANMCIILVDFQSASNDSEEEVSCSQWTRNKYNDVTTLQGSPRFITEDDIHTAINLRGCYKRLKHENKLKFRVGAMANDLQARTDEKNVARKNDGRKQLCNPNVEVSDVYNMLLNQKGRCAYTNVPLRVTGHWKFSIERVNDDIGYLVSNVVLVVAEVNNGCNRKDKWSRAKAEFYWGPIRKGRVKLTHLCWD
jgi:hypothetical protein